ncbi:hypothetical protein HanIR_Chr11g0556311 [Helianthus annuus]|nr:hypothetical protein HanIR_Chr11g0556311 [Helianthus annuus]
MGLGFNGKSIWIWIYVALFKVKGWTCQKWITSGEFLRARGLWVIGIYVHVCIHVFYTIHR